jgi:hypothetical protein
MNEYKAEGGLLLSFVVFMQSHWTVTIKYMDIDDQGQDYLTIVDDLGNEMIDDGFGRDDVTVAGRMNGRIGGLTRTFYVGFRRLAFMFRTDASSNGRGFTLTYQAHFNVLGTCSNLACMEEVHTTKSILYKGQGLFYEGGLAGDKQCYWSVVVPPEIGNFQHWIVNLKFLDTASGKDYLAVVENGVEKTNDGLADPNNPVPGKFFGARQDVNYKFTVTNPRLSFTFHSDPTSSSGGLGFLLRYHAVFA